jgi:glycosyltransferase involved in cell wall biosynthesis
MTSGEPTRLAMVIPDLRVGGLQAMAVGLARALEQTEWEPTIYTFDGGGGLESALAEVGIGHVNLPRSPGVDPGHARRLARRFREDGIELVHCHNITALFHGARAARGAGRLPVLYTEHDREMPAPWRHRVLHRWLSRRVTSVVAVCEQLARALIATEGFPPDRTGTLVNGVPDPRERYSGTREQARAELGWDDAPVVLAVGSLTDVKNHSGLIALFARVREACSDARLVIAGEGPLRPVLEESAGQLPDASVQLLGERDDVDRLLAASDVFALSSRSEGLSLSLIEAHGAGRPSVAYDVGGNGEVLLHGETGRLVSADDSVGFAEALAGLLADPAERGRMGTTARARYQGVFTLDRMVAGYVRLYRRLRDARGT